MKAHSKKASQQIANTEDDDFFVFESDKVRERFMQGCRKSVDSKLPEYEEIENMERPPATRHHKKRTNRLFRERLNSTFLPFPEADNAYERARAKIIIKLRINKLIDLWETRRRKRLIKKYEKRYNER